MRENQDNNPTQFDFDYWMNLAKENPSAFDEERGNKVKSLIESAPEHMRERLYGLQWRIDMEIKLGKSPMDSCLRVYRMMLDSIYGENGLLDALTRLTESGNSPTSKNKPRGEILNFSTHSSRPSGNSKK